MSMNMSDEHRTVKWILYCLKCKFRCLTTCGRKYNLKCCETVNPFVNVDSFLCSSSFYFVRGIYLVFDEEFYWIAAQKYNIKSNKRESEWQKDSTFPTTIQLEKASIESDFDAAANWTKTQSELQNICVVKWLKSSQFVYAVFSTFIYLFLDRPKSLSLWFHCHNSFVPLMRKKMFGSI